MVSLTHILLVNPPSLFTGVNVGLLYAGSFLEENGYSVEIFDFNLLQDPWTELRRKIDNLDYIGISCMTAQVKGALQVSKLIRQCDPELPVIWGGVHPTLYPLQTCANENVDYVVYGEGEHTLLELINVLQDGKFPISVRGVAYKERKLVKLNPLRPFLNLDDLPQPHYNLIDIKKYRQSDPEDWFPVHAGRGCPHRCTFCINTTINKRVWRGRSPQKILDDIELLHDKFRINKIIFNDDNFATSRQRVYNICRGLKERGLDVYFSADIRANYLNEEFLGFLAKHGLIRIGIGAESGSDRILRMIKKDITEDQVIQSAKLCKRFQVVPFYSFMIGLPDERREDILRTLSLIRTLKKLCPIATFTELQLYRPYPGTELFEKVKSLGFRQPQSLEEWASSFDEFIPPHELPWIRDPHEVQMLRFISWFGRASLRSALFHCIKNIKHPRKMPMTLFTFDCVLRWNLRILKMTPEIDLAARLFPHAFEGI